MTEASAIPPGWEPNFDACSVKQERLVREFCAEIAGPRGQKGSPPDPVRLLEMAQALYEAEREDLGAAAPTPASRPTDAEIIELAKEWGAFEPSRFGPENPMQFHTGEPGVIGFARELLALGSQGSKG